MQEYFKALVMNIENQLCDKEQFTCSFHGEKSDFSRFNQGRIRQSGTVVQSVLQINLIQGQRHLKEAVSLSGNPEQDKRLIGESLAFMRKQLPEVPEDPYLLINEKIQSSTHVKPSQLPDSDIIMNDALVAIVDMDFVGIYAGGDIYRGFANSLGQVNWYESATFNFDWSLYAMQDKAVKQSYAGYSWYRPDFEMKLQQGREQLEILKHPAKTIDPGGYRVYLSPAALEEIMSIISWGGFGLKARLTKSSPLIKLHDGTATLSPALQITENVADSIAPNFDEAGFIKPDSIALIEGGKARDHLISARSAKEYDKTTTGASAEEMPESIWLEAGDLPQEKVLEKLGTGLYINNLWYMNYSDRAAGRVTGMTRFASFWVENGKIVAPLNVMRFDESIFRLLGSQLEALTSTRELILSSMTYDQRSTSSACLPGALVADMNFTL